MSEQKNLALNAAILKMDESGNFSVNKVNKPLDDPSMPRRIVSMNQDILESHRRRLEMSDEERQSLIKGLKEIRGTPG